MGKKITTDCKVCKKKITVEIDPDIVKEKDYFPFEYIHIHGDPEHALMLFIDKKLTCRETAVYSDLAIARQQSARFSRIAKMSERDMLMSIYSDPLRMKVFERLRSGPVREEDLISYLKEDPSFDEEEFNLLILPFEKTGLVKSGWLHDSFVECYFLVNDFVFLRTPPIRVLKLVRKDVRFNAVYRDYVNAVLGMFKSYEEMYVSDEIGQILKDFTAVGDEGIANAMSTLDRPKTSQEIGIARDKLKLMVDNELAVELNIRDKIYYAPLCKLEIIRFAPDYIVGNLINGIMHSGLRRDVVTKHLDLLYNNNEKA